MRRDPSSLRLAGGGARLSGARLNDDLLNEVYFLLCEERVEEGMDVLLDGLTRRRLDFSDEQWEDYVRRCLEHPLADLVFQDPFTHRARVKPRGYPGDAVLLDYIYHGARGDFELPPETTELGRRIFRYNVKTPPTLGVRARACHVAGLIDELARGRRRPHLLSIACGHLPEATLSGALRQGAVDRWVGLDADPLSLAELQRRHGDSGVVETVEGSVRQIVAGKLELDEFDLVYSTGLYDYLHQPLGARLLQRLFDMVAPGGAALIANFLPNIWGLGYMESYMDWRLVYRGHAEMLDLALSLDQSRVADIRLLVEESQNIVILQVTRRLRARVPSSRGVASV